MTTTVQTAPLFLSRLIIDPLDRHAQRDLASPYEMHRTIMGAFPPDLDRTEHRVLFRVEVPDRARHPAVLVQSTIQPDWDSARSESWCLRVESKPFKIEVAQGTRLIFRLRANPTVCRDGKRHGLFREDAQIAWLERKGRDSGFEVLHCLPISEGNVVFHRGEDPESTLFAVCYDGVLRVTDGALVREAVARGVGRGKGMGFGLLSLASSR